MYRRLRLVFCLAFLQGATHASAQMEVAGYDIRRIGVQNGLTNQIVTSVAQDRNNAIWFGTNQGLYRYDGVRTIRLDTTGRTLPQQYSSFITDVAITPGPDELVFVCTKYRAGIIDPQTCMPVPAGGLGIPDSVFQDFVQIKRGGEDFFWGLRHRTICKIDKLGPRRYACTPRYRIPEAPPGLTLTPDHADPDAVWILPENKREVWHVGPQGMVRYDLPASKKNLPGMKGLLQLIFTAGGTFGWDVAQNVYKFDERRRQFIHAGGVSGLYSLIPNLAAVDIAMKQRESLRCYLHLDINQVVLGTTLGLFIVRKKTTGFHIQEALREEEIRGIYPDSTGKWAVGTYFGLYTGRLRHSVVKKHPDIKVVWGFLPLNKTQCLLALEQRNGLQLWDPVAEKIVDSTLTRRFPHPSPPEGISALSIAQDPYGKKWAGTYTGLLWSPPDSPFVFRPYKDPASGLPFGHADIRAVLISQDSALWLGASDGLFCMRYDNSAKQYRLNPDAPNPGKVAISDLYEDRSGNIWVATKGKGIALLTGGSRQIQWFGVSAGLCDSMVCRIESSGNDSILWISTHNGLSRLDLHTGIFHNFYEESGFPGNEFNSAASARFSDGTLMFGGVNGLIYFHPDSVAVPEFQYETSVPYVQIYGKNVDTLLAWNQFSSGLHLAPYPELIEFVLGSNELIQPGKIRYRYRLLGLSDKWNYTTGNNEVKYVHLSPGTYEFQVQAVPLDGHFGKIFVLPVFVATPFYETWWFRAFIIGLVLLCVYGIYRYRLRQILKEQFIRQQVADDLHDDIGNKLNIIGIIAQKVASFLRNTQAGLPSDNSLDKLLDLSRETQISLITMIWAVDPSKDRLVNLIVRMQDFADDFVRPLLSRFTFTAPEIVPDRDVNLRIRHHLLLIYQELLVNMIKHTHPDRISVELRLEGNKIVIVLLNIHQPGLGRQYDTISGNRGRSTLNRRLKEINGSIEYRDTEDALQKITLTVPQIFKKT